MMTPEVVVLIAEDDEGHATLIERNLRRAGISNEILRFRDGRETLDFLQQKNGGRHRISGARYLLLLDIQMPGVDGVQVLREMKQDAELCKIPVIVITTTDDPREVAQCHQLGCSNYITKPVDYERFVECIRQLGFFLLIVEIPRIDGD